MKKHMVLTLKNNRSLLFLILCIIPFLFVVGCDGSAESSGADGSVSFSIAWPEGHTTVSLADLPLAVWHYTSTNNTDSDWSSARVSPLELSDDDCGPVSQMQARVQTAAGGVLAEDLFNCVDHEGALGGITPGSNRVLSITARMFVEEMDTHEMIYYGEAPDITITAGQITNVGEVFLDLVNDDDDLLPDKWEYENFQELTATNGDQDSDEDGRSDYEEFLQGTNPTVMD